jgi:pheromone a factor receptor
MEFFSVNENLSSCRFFRLMGLAGIEMLCTIPLSAYTIYLNATAQPVLPWISWANVHFNFSRVEQIPSVVWRSSGPAVLSIELSRWFLVVCAFVFFAFFGFADEARKNYCLAYVSVAKRMGLLTAGTVSPEGSWCTGYVVIPQHSMIRPDQQKKNQFENRDGIQQPRCHYARARHSTHKRDSLTSFSTDISIGELNIAFNDVKETPSETAMGSI